MKRLTTAGKCRFCNNTFNKIAMRRHLDKCEERQTFEQSKQGKKMRLFRIEVQGRCAPEYWMHLEVAADAKLKALDNFLRDIWLECCWHLSAFTIEGQKYISQVDRDSFF